MFFLQVIALLGAVSAPPTPQQYYARALDTMNALPQAAYAAYDIDMRSSGAGMMAHCQKAEGQYDSAAFSVGWGKGLKNHFDVRARYTLAGNRAEIEEADGTYCGDNIALFKPEWASVDDWMRYGLSGTPRSRPAASVTPAPAPAGTIRTIASVTAIAPSAYRIYDMGARECPSGSAGHALHLIARTDPDAHPLMDVIVEQKTMRFCMVRFSLVSATIAGTGAKGDVVVDLGQNGDYWTVTHEHAALALRLLGASLKRFAFDFTFSNMRYLPPSSK